MRGKLRLASTIILALLTACGGAAARKAGYLAKGREFLAAHNYVKARLEFRNALQVDPNDAEASYLAGEAAEQLGNLREAAQMFQGAIQSNAKHVGARAQLALVYAESGNAARALELLGPALAVAPDDPDVLTARAAARSRQGAIAEARTDAEKAARIAPDNEHAVMMLANLEQQAGESGQAIELIARAAQSPGSSTRLKHMLAQLYLKAHRHPEAQQVLQRLIVAEPGDLRYRYELAQVQLLDRNVDGAEATLRAGIAQAPKSAEAKLALANMLAANRSYAVAEAELKRMSAAAPADYALHLGLGQFYVAHGKVPEAQAVYREIVREDGTGPEGLLARDRLAAVLLSANKPDEAAPLVEEVLKKNPRDNEALYTHAQLALLHHKPETAITDLRTLQRDQPKAMPVVRALARAFQANNDATLAEETLRAALQNSPADPDLRFDLAQLLAGSGRNDQAAPLLDKLAAEQPANVPVLEALFRVQLLRKDYAGALHSAAQVEAAQPTLPSGPYLSGVAEQAAGKAAAARADFERALKLSPLAIDPFTALVRLDLAERHPDPALARLDRTIAQAPANAILRNLKGEALFSLRRYEAAIASFREAIERAPDWPMGYHNLALALTAAGRPPEAIQSLQAGIRASHPPTLLVADLAERYQRSGQLPEAIATYEAELRRDPNSDFIANNLAMLLADHQTDRASLDRARVLAERFASSRNGGSLDTWGWVLYRRGEFNDALNALQKASDLAPQSAAIRYHLGMAQLKSGSRDAGRASLQVALRSPSFEGRDEAQHAFGSL